MLQELLVVPEFDIAKSKGYGAGHCQLWRFCVFADTEEEEEGDDDELSGRSRHWGGISALVGCRSTFDGSDKQCDLGFGDWVGVLVGF